MKELTPEEEWIRQDGVGFSISGNVITIPRTSLRRLIEERERLNRFAKECGTKLVPCPKCGCGMLAKDTQCVLCELTEVRSELEHYKRLIKAIKWFEADGVPVED